MPNRTDDYSDGDSRQPYVEEGGPAGHHARTHDVRAEEATRAKPRQRPEDDQFAGDLTAEHRSGSHLEESVLAVDDDKTLRKGITGLDPEQVRGLTVLTAGTALHQGSVYLDLNQLDRGPFKAVGNEQAGPDNRYVAKRDTDYETWDRLVGRTTV